MNYPHLHLMVNHLPVIGAFVALGLVLWALLKGSRELMRLALGVTLLAGLSSYVAFFTGDEAHEQLEDMKGYDHDRTHEHEEAAEAAMIVMLVTGGLGGVGLFVSRGDRKVPGWASGLVTVGLLASSAAVVRAALLGGAISHVEVRQPLFQPPTEAGSPSAPATVDSTGAAKQTHADGTEHEHKD